MDKTVTLKERAKDLVRKAVNKLPMQPKVASQFQKSASEVQTLTAEIRTLQAEIRTLQATCGQLQDVVKEWW